MTRKPVRKFAEGTTVSVSSTQEQIRTMLEKHGDVNGFVSGDANGIAMLSFQMNERRLTFRMGVPPNDPAELRRKWRALHLSIKAKLESVSSGIETFEDAFLAQTVMPTGQTVGEWAQEAIPAALKGRPMPPLIEGPK